MRKIFALSSILTLLLTAMPVLADGEVPAANIVTYFHNTGFISGFEEMTALNDYGEGIVESIYAFGDHSLTVIKQGDYTYHHDGDYVSLNEDKWIMFETDCHGCGADLFVGKDVWWGQEGFGAGDVYRYVKFYDDEFAFDEVHAGGIGTGSFMDRIETPKPTFVYQSVGLNQFATCDFEPPVFEPLNPPECSWCAI